MANPEHLEILRQGAEAWNEWRKVKGIDLTPDLTKADLSHLNLQNIDFSETDLTHAYLYETDLSGATLNDAILLLTDIERVSLRGATIIGVDFTYTDLQDVDLTNATIGALTFGRKDLRVFKGLETVRHEWPSTIGIDTLYISGAEIPEVFLRGCGVPESFIVQIPSLIAAMQPIEFYSCFISYSSTDQEFAERLHADLQAKVVRVWFAPHDLPIGARIRPAIDESIRLHDKLLLVLSESSVSSQWVEQEVETALSRERAQEGKVVLFPIRIDDAVIEIKSGWPALLKNTRNVGDFTRWKDHDSYHKAFERLLRDLKAGT